MWLSRAILYFNTKYLKFALGFNPKSNNADEFINHEEILETLEYAKNNGFDYVIIDGAETTDFLLGDVNSDGTVNSSDASAVLAEYSAIQTGGASTLSAEQKKAADVNADSKIDSTDASKILEYYAAVSTGQIPNWNEMWKVCEFLEKSIDFWYMCVII